MGVASPAPNIQIDHDNCSYAQPIVVNMTATRAFMIEIVDVASKLIPQRFKLSIIAQL